ncbi:hypothetical protein N183_35035 [Sinorhizobium sp. Sb3]|nr:hypothetical protein N183_35035 [Sinorhizobium sp. Sb3]
MPRSVRDKLNQLSAGSIGGDQFIKNVTDAVYDIYISSLIAPPHIVSFSCLAVGSNQIERAGVVVNIQPVSNILAVTIDS